MPGHHNPIIIGPFLGVKEVGIIVYVTVTFSGGSRIWVWRGQVIKIFSFVLQSWLFHFKKYLLNIFEHPTSLPFHWFSYPTTIRCEPDLTRFPSDSNVDAHVTTPSSPFPSLSRSIVGRWAHSHPHLTTPQPALILTFPWTFPVPLPYRCLLLYQIINHIGWFK